MIFASSENMKCFGCGAEGHIIRSCPEKLKKTQLASAADGDGAAKAGRGSQCGSGSRCRRSGSRVGVAVPPV